MNDNEPNHNAVNLVQQNEQYSNHASLVEEEPPHEFYARLCGKPVNYLHQKLFVPTSSSQSHAIHNLVLSSSSISIIPPDCDKKISERNEEESSAFSKAYKYASTNPKLYFPPQLNSSNCQKKLKLRQKMEWKKEDGKLGKRRDGSLCPITKKWNEYRRGLGSSKLMGKITHHDNSTTLTRKEKKARYENGKIKPNRAQRKRKRREKEEKEKLKDKKVKLMLRTDVSDNYERLYWSHCS